MSAEITILPKEHKRKNMQPPVLPSADEITALLDIARQSVSSHRPAVYPDTKEGLEAFKDKVEQYFDFIDETNNALEDPSRYLFPDIEGLAVYAGITRATLATYGKRQSDFGLYIARVKDSIAMIKKSMALKNRMSPVLAIFDLVNNHHYINASEFHLVNEETPDKVAALPATSDYFCDDLLLGGDPDMLPPMH